MKLSSLNAAVLILVLAVQLSLAPGAHAQCEQKLAPSELEYLDHFGLAVALDGDTVLVGAPNDDDVAEDAGAAYVYERGGSGWIQASKLVAWDGAYADYFGRSVALDGETAVIGAWRHDTSGGSTGAAYVFQRTAAGWLLSAELVPSIPVSGAAFGLSVAIDEDTIVVGAYQDNGLSQRTGAAYVFQRGATGWSETAKLVASDGAIDDYFGLSVAIYGNVAAVGAPDDFDASCFSGEGTAYVFREIGGSWLEEQKLIPASCFHVTFGRSVAVFGDSVLVGDPELGGNVGRAYFFGYDGSSWSETQHVIGSGIGPSDVFGVSVALHGGRAVIGSRSADGHYPHVGAAHVFERSASTWVEARKLFASDGEFDDRFGCAVDIDESSAVVGTERDQDGGWASGSAYVYDLDSCGPACSGGPDGSVDCPCLNASVQGGSGCRNSTGNGAYAFAFGSTNAVQDDLVVAGQHLPPSRPALLFVGDAALNGGKGVPFGDGLACASGNVVRLGVRTPAGAGRVRWGSGLRTLGGWAPGDTRYFQIWYRDPDGPCGSGFDLTNGLRVNFQP